MNIGVHVSFSGMTFSEYMPHSVIAGSYGSSIFSFLRNLRTFLYNGGINLHAHQQSKSAPLFSHTSPAFTICKFFEVKG